MKRKPRRQEERLSESLAGAIGFGVWIRVFMDISFHWLVFCLIVDDDAWRRLVHGGQLSADLLDLHCLLMQRNGERFDLLLPLCNGRREAFLLLRYRRFLPCVAKL